ncbi:AIM23 [Candida oxycetoniae]|uniref:Altered inheritance of mitochondria protein 23, mitochondrial n=1 Tax=Candida oxycetoniae TaxID=497107 RepID=A0AAI9SWX7_9ASCO|nr:AIM23 [Candida oxycetoniae]KAI3404264.2 AIM23 [Candida oxycetoniae]
MTLPVNRLLSLSLLPKRLISKSSKICGSRELPNQSRKQYDYNSFTARNNNGNYKRSSSSSLQQQQQQQQQRQQKYQRQSRNGFDLQKILEKGSEKVQDAFISVLSKISQASPNYQVETVTPSGLVKVHLQEILKDLNLSNEGIQLIQRNSSSDRGGRSLILPLVKKCKTEEMIRSYNEELASRKELELLNLGSRKTIKMLDQKLKAKQKQSMEKTIFITWGISLRDLKLQKFNELKTRLSKGEKLNLYIVYDKRKMNLKVDEIYKDKESLDLEMKRRELVKSSVESLLDEEDLDWKWNCEGSLRTKLVYNISAANVPEKQKNTPKAVNTSSEKKTNKIENKSRKEKVNEEDLDALYSIKIED